MTVPRLNMERRRWIGLVALALTASALIPAAFALACNPQAYLTIGKSSYSPGESVRVSGSFFKNNASITVSVDRTGQSTTVTTSANGAFQATFALPAGASTGGYTVTAIGFEANGDVIAGLPARGSFSVATAQAAPAPTPTPAAAAPPTPAASSASGIAQAPAQASAPAAQSAPTAAKPSEEPAATSTATRPTRVLRPATGYREPSVTREPNVQTSSGTPRGGGGGGTGGSSGSGGGGGGGGGGGTTATPSVGSSADGRPVFSGSVAPTVNVPAPRVTTVVAAPARAASPQAAPADRSSRSSDSSRSAAQVSSQQAAEQTAADDVWGSMSTDRSPSVMPVAGDGVAVESPRSGSNLAMGLLLLGIGAALAGGLAAAAARRRVRAS